MTAPAPAAALLDAARTIAAHQPADPAELADTLRALNDLTGPSVFGLLGEAFDRWAEAAHTWPGGEMIADHLSGAGERLATVAESLDRARADTGHYNDA